MKPQHQDTPELELELAGLGARRPARPAAARNRAGGITTATPLQGFAFEIWSGHGRGSSNGAGPPAAPQTPLQ